jgi:hypothetical protein
MTAASIRRLRGGLVAASEGGWVGVVYAALGVGLFHRGAALGVLPFVVAAGVGLAIARSGDRSPASRRLVGAVIVGAVLAGAALVGILMERPPALTDGLLLPGPWCLALAAWRGLRRGDADGDDVAISDLLARGGPALAVPWLVGTVGGSASTMFLAPALVGTLIFVAAGLAAIGLARLERLARDDGAGTAESGMWLRLLVLVVGGTAIAGLPVAWLVGIPLRAVAAAIFGPMADAFAAVGHALGELLPSAGTSPESGIPGGAGASGPGGGAPDVGVLPPVVLGVVLLLLILALVKLGRDRTAGARVNHPVPRDEPQRRFERPQVNLHLPHIGRPAFMRRRARATTATGAYLAVLGQMATVPTLARAPAETVRIHARRVAPTTGYRLNLLAADYEREQYGAGPVSPAETRRALGRARDLAAQWSRAARKTARKTRG